MGKLAKTFIATFHGIAGIFLAERMRELNGKSTTSKEESRK